MSASSMVHEAERAGVDMLLPGMGLVQQMLPIRGTRGGLWSRPRHVSLITSVLICFSQIGLAAAQEQRSSSGVQRLDEGAIKLMKKATERWTNTQGCIAGEFHFSAKPPARTEDGK
jgi:hypothetical protein